MRSSLFTGCLIILLLAVLPPLSSVSAQGLDLRKDAPFFRAKVPEFQAWLRQNQLDGVLVADSVAVSSRKVTLFLRSAYKGARVCDSLQCAWDRLEKTNFRVQWPVFPRTPAAQMGVPRRGA